MVVYCPARALLLCVIESTVGYRTTNSALARAPPARLMTLSEIAANSSSCRRSAPRTLRGNGICMLTQADGRSTIRLSIRARTLGHQIVGSEKLAQNR